jgi:hypothetical protein
VSFRTPDISGNNHPVLMRSSAVNVSEARLPQLGRGTR